jgi:hypothetical protein
MLILAPLYLKFAGSSDFTHFQSSQPCHINFLSSSQSTTLEHQVAPDCSIKPTFFSILNPNSLGVTQMGVTKSY